MKKLCLILFVFFTAQIHLFAGSEELALNVSAVATDATCGVADGTITISVIGGTAPYNYSIDGGSTYQSGNFFSGLPAGSYNIVVQDGLGDFGFTTTIILELPTTLTLTPLLFPPTCGMADGNITIIPSGGSGTYTYSINNGASFQALNGFTGLSQGDYYLVVNDGTTCQAYDTVSLVSNIPHIDSIHVIDVTCYNDCNGSLEIFASGGTGSLSYSIDGGATFVASNIFVSLCSGSYLVVIGDGLGCNDDTLITINQPTEVTQIITPLNTNCGYNNGEVAITASGGNGYYTYSIDGGLSFLNSSVFDSLLSGTYTVITHDSLNCSSVLDTVVLDTSFGISGVSVSTIENCNTSNGQLDISVVGGTTYLWSTGSSISTIAVTPIVTTTYTVNIANALCNDVDTVTITVVNPPVTVVTASDTLVCPYDSVLLTANGGETYFWNTGDTNSSIYVNPAYTSVYSCIASASGCPDITPDLVQINVYPAADANITASATAVVIGDSIVFSGLGTIGTSFYWQFGNGDTDTIPVVTYTYSSPGTYTVYLTTQLGECYDTDTVIITISTAPGFQEYAMIKLFELYPNPNDGNFNLRMELATFEDVTIRIVNLLGENLYCTRLNNIQTINEKINVNNLNSGLFYLMVEFHDQLVIKKFEVIK